VASFSWSVAGAAFLNSYFTSSDVVFDSPIGSVTFPIPASSAFYSPAIGVLSFCRFISSSTRSFDV